MQLTRRSVLGGLALTAWSSAKASSEILTFAAPDGAPVSGLRYGEGDHGVVLVPGGHGVGETWHMQAQRLAQAGFQVLAMNYRGRGTSNAVPPNDEKTHLDVLGAISQLKASGAARISVVGASWGGWAAGTAGIAQPGLIDRLVLLAHSPFEHPERLGGRKLFIVARDDRDGGGRQRLESIGQQFERSPEPKRLIVLEGAAHAQFLFLTDQGERLYSEILHFLSAA